MGQQWAGERTGTPCRSPTAGSPTTARAHPKEVWLSTSSKEAFQAGLESGGVTAFVFGPAAEQRALAAAWAGLARFRALLLDERGALVEQLQVGGSGGAAEGRVVGEVVTVDGPEAARALEARVQRHQQQRQQAAGAAAAAADEWSLVLDASDWKVIPAENLVALAQPSPTARGDSPSTSSSSGSPSSSPAPPLRLLAATGSAGEARLMLEALEAGTTGVLLRSDDPAQVRELVRYVRRRASEEGGGAQQRLPYQAAVVVAVRALGMGDRACVDLAGLLQPGEGLLVGSFARCLALVHSECDQTDYIASRPFRVNAGPVHSYVAAPGGRTRYLCELASGSEVLVSDAAGRTRSALVGRVKIERRPLVLVELETADGARHSIMLQNAETVKLVGPAGPAAGATARAGGPAGPAAGATARTAVQQIATGNEAVGTTGAPEVVAAAAGGNQSDGWRAISVSALQPGDRVFVLMQAAARHTGIAIEEFIVEK